MAKENGIFCVEISQLHEGHNKEYFSMNTCSIDYFLIIIFIIRMNHMEQFNQLKNIEIGNVFEKIYGHLSCNDWQMARLAWLEFCPGLKQTIKNNKLLNICVV